MSCIQIGTGAKARGICCVAIGNHVEARGAFQVVVGESITIPENIPTEQIISFIEDLKDSILTYHELSRTKFAPDLFGRKAEGAIKIVIEILEDRLPKEEEVEEKL